MKKSITLLLVLVMLCSFVIPVSASNEVYVNIAPFPVYLYDMVVNSAYAEYPVITYKDVSYIPLTYDLCERCSINCGWDNEKGLYIVNHNTKSVNTFELKPFGGFLANPLQNKYKAVVPTYDIYINGQKFDNKNQEYPLLNFRNVTYFPLTYDIVHNELGWFINWDAEKWLLEVEPNHYQKLSPYIVKMEDDHTVLKDQVGVYKTSLNEYGDTRYTLDYYYYNYFVLGHNQDILTRVDTEYEDNYSYRDTGNGIDALERTELKDDGLYFDGKLIKNATLTPVTSEGLSVVPPKVASARLFEFKDRRFLDVTIYINAGIPAPYTPKTKYLFTETNGEYTQVDEWLSAYNLENIIEDGLGGYYLYSHSTSWQGMSRWSNSFSVIFHIDKDGNITNLADKYEDYNSLYVVGQHNGDLYVKALYFNDPKAMQGNESISAVNDGYFILEKGTHNLKKLYPYTYGEPFVTKDGGFYLISCTPFEYRVINLLNGKVIKAY